MSQSAAVPDVIVLGGGLVGLACAAALSERSLRVLLIGESRAGEASPAAAGMLAPSLEPADAAAHRFALAARDHYPDYLARLAERTGIAVALARGGILQVALSERTAETQQRALPGDAAWMDARALAMEEPALAHAAGATHHSRDGAVDNVGLIAALDRLLGRDRRITRSSRCAVRIAPEQSRVGLALDDGSRLEADWLVLAAGAWVGTLPGLPRALPVEPVRGQMISVAGTPIHHVTYGPNGYLVPRGRETLVGATMERVGFDPSLTAEGRAALGDAAREISPALVAPVLRHWSGLRPMTPDGQPIIGPDPSYPRLIYACGHSRHGILLAPWTGESVASLVTGASLVSGASGAVDLTPFRIERFAVAA